MSKIMTIALVGATGMLRQVVARELIATGFTVRVKRLFPTAEVVFGDLLTSYTAPAV